MGQYIYIRILQSTNDSACHLLPILSHCRMHSSDNYIKLGKLALAPLELFYAVAEETRDKIAAGTDSEDIKQFLADANFSKLLLSLREMFLNQTR